MFGRRMPAQDQGPGWDHAGGHRARARERQAPPPPMHPYPTAPGVADQYARYSPVTADQLIRADHTPWYPLQSGVVRAGTGRASWWAAGPPRLELVQRDVTVNPRQGNSRSRYPVDPRNPTLGLHTTPVTHTVGTVPRYVDPQVGQMRAGRQNRLSQARYSGQSYSATTLTQGGRR